MRILGIESGRFQEEISGVHVEPLSVVYGTAYGTAKLLKEYFEM